MRKRILTIILIVILTLFSIVLADPNEADGNQTCSLQPGVEVEAEVSIQN